MALQDLETLTDQDFERYEAVKTKKTYWTRTVKAPILSNNELEKVLQKSKSIKKEVSEQKEEVDKEKRRQRRVERYHEQKQDPKWLEVKRQKAREYYHQNKNQINRKRNEWRQKRGENPALCEDYKEKRRIYQRDYYLNHKEYFREYHRKYRKITAKVRDSAQRSTQAMPSHCSAPNESFVGSPSSDWLSPPLACSAK